MKKEIYNLQKKNKINNIELKNICLEKNIEYNKENNIITDNELDHLNNIYLQNEIEFFDINSDIEDNITYKQRIFQRKGKINYSKRFREKYKNN